LNKYTKIGPKNRAMKQPRHLVRQERREQPKQVKPEAKGKKTAGKRYDPKILQHACFVHTFGQPSASNSIDLSESQMQWCPSPMMPTYSICDPYRQIWVNYPLMMPMTSWGREAPRQPIFERLEFPVNDRVDSSFSQHKIKPIKEGKVVLKSEIERTTTEDVIQVDTSQVKLGEEFNGLLIIDDQVDVFMEDVTPNHREEKTDKVVNSKYLQPRWCPPGLTRTQKRKLQ
jgi:hypothetical protein